MELQPAGEFKWRIPKTRSMRVDGLVFASESLIVKAREDKAVDQVANVAHLPGIVGSALAMPDIHWGYGFPIGGVAATDIDNGGVVSPGGVGFDIGCGVRLLVTDVDARRLRQKLVELLDELYRSIPHGVGGHGMLQTDAQELRDVMQQGAKWALGRGIGNEEDAEYTEDRGTIEGADPGVVSDRALERGGMQLGSLGAGNHFLEVQVVDEIFGAEEAKALGLAEGQICVMIHTGSRGLGHQICTEEVRSVEAEMSASGIIVPDRQLACAPVSSHAGERYLGAMKAAANFARTNRHFIAHGVRSCFSKVFGTSDGQVRTLYDISHNVAKNESYEIEGTQKTLCVHRKGATRSFGPGHPELPERYRAIGQPVLVPGSMGTASWVAVGTSESAKLSFGSTCHGAGRRMSRKAATKEMDGRALQRQLEDQGIIVRAGELRTLAEEAPYAYKDVDEVIEVCDRVGLSKKVARLRPLAVVKG